MDKKYYESMFDDYDTLKYSFSLLSTDEMNKIREILCDGGKQGWKKSDEQITNISEQDERFVSKMLESVVEKIFDKMEEK